MGFSEKAFARAAAVWMAAAYAVCAAFALLFPDLALKLVGWMFHLVDVKEAGEMRVTLGGFVGGFVQLVLYAYFGAWFFARLLKRFSRSGAAR